MATKKPPTRRGKPPAKRGLKPRLTPELDTRLLALVRSGVPLSIACCGVGIAYRTVSVWRSRAALGEQPYQGFMDRLDQARAEAQASLCIQLRKSSAKDWRAAAWLLERTNWEEFGTKAPLPQAEATNLGPVEIRITQHGTPASSGG